MAKITKDMEGKRVLFKDEHDNEYVQDIVFVHEDRYSYIGSFGTLNTSYCDGSYEIEVLGPTPKQKKKVLKAQAVMEDSFGNPYCANDLFTGEHWREFCTNVGHKLLKFPAGEQIEVEVDE